MERRVDAIFFDVMDTLVYDPFAVELPAFFDMDIPSLLAAKHPTAWVDFELGKIDEATFFATFFLDGRPIDGEALRETMRAAYRWLDGVEPLLIALRAQGIPLYALSNYPTWWEMIEEKLGLGRYLDWRFVSCQAGVRKPDAHAYLGPLRALGLEPQRCIFVDDRGSNCKAASEVGIHAIKFEGAGALRDALIARGALG
jgi:FMN hydrolase / 5-amino-6-(5-phospho-D-ribitylamino)uracil phosphatase